ncbi:MAG TPA: ABC transporter substrate-binding protein [Acidimicrobiales bacterium]
MKRVAALLSTIVLAAACTNAGESTPSTTAQPTTTTTSPDRGNVDGVLTLGVLLPMTGPSASIGAPMVKAVEMAVDEINRAGGIKGRPVRLVEHDEGETPATAAAALGEMLDAGIDAIIGPASHRTTVSLLDRLIDDNIAVCLPTSTSIALSAFDDRGLLVRTMPSDLLQARALARAIAATGRGSVVVFEPDDDYGARFGAALRDGLAAQDVTVTTTEAYDPTGEAFDAVVGRAVEQRPEAVAVIGNPDPGGHLLADLRAEQVLPALVPTFVTDGMRRRDLFESVDPGRPVSVSGISGTAPAEVPEGSKWFGDAFALFAPGTNLSYAAYAYDCANLLALASLAAGSDDARQLAPFVVPTSRSGLVCRNYPTCSELMLDGRNVDLDGASGLIELTADGDPTVGVFDLFTFDSDGRDVVERQIQVSS